MQAGIETTTRLPACAAWRTASLTGDLTIMAFGATQVVVSLSRIGGWQY
jgi:hypothetical protein